jgi:hypothetical protein
MMVSCVKNADETILVNDPQQIMLLNEWPEDLLVLYGEENICFGDVPPIVNCGFRANHKYAEVQIDGMSGPPVGTLTPITRYYRFEEQYIAIAKLHCYQTNGIDEHRVIYPVFLTGHEDDGTFTAYFTDTVQTPGMPVHKVVMSGRLTPRGIENYRYGYKIVEYLDSEVPSNAYPLNSVFVFEDADGVADYDNWHE